VATGDESRRFVPYDEAFRAVVAAGRAHRTPAERIELDDAFGRVLREEIVADEPSPRFANSAMDGYAVRAADVAGACEASPVRVEVTETIAAGRVPTRPVGPGQAARIMTGAPLPPGADAVVPVERTRPDGALGDGGNGDGLVCGRALLLGDVQPGEHVRPAGEDFPVGERLLGAGAVIDGGAIALLASIGHAFVDVAVPPRVAILSTGDELVAPHEPVGPGQIRDSNRHMVRALVRAAGGELGPVWHLLDDAEAFSAAFARVKDRCDVVVSIGGVSAGDFDPVKQALSRLDGIELWRVGMRPGQPQAFGVIDGKLFFGMPGNPVSSAVVFEMLVRPALWAMLGREPLERPFVHAVLAERVGSKSGRRDFLRVRLEPLDDAEAVSAGAPYRAHLTGTQSSGALSSVHKSHGLAVVPDAEDALEAGARVDVLLWKGGLP
jgi:molybdopterin molybdotransferase